MRGRGRCAARGGPSHADRGGCGRCDWRRAAFATCCLGFRSAEMRGRGRGRLAPFPPARLHLSPSILVGIVPVLGRRCAWSRRRCCFLLCQSAAVSPVGGLRRFLRSLPLSSRPRRPTLWTGSRPLVLAFVAGLPRVIGSRAGRCGLGGSPGGRPICHVWPPRPLPPRTVAVASCGRGPSLASGRRRRSGAATRVFGSYREQNRRGNQLLRSRCPRLPASFLLACLRWLRDCRRSLMVFPAHKVVGVL